MKNLCNIRSHIDSSAICGYVVSENCNKKFILIYFFKIFDVLLNYNLKYIYIAHIFLNFLFFYLWLHKHTHTQVIPVNIFTKLSKKSIFNFKLIEVNITQKLWNSKIGK